MMMHTTVRRRFRCSCPGWMSLLLNMKGVIGTVPEVVRLSVLKLMRVSDIASLFIQWYIHNNQSQHHKIESNALPSSHIHRGSML
jgi:hypothetical protein